MKSLLKGALRAAWSLRPRRLLPRALYYHSVGPDASLSLPAEHFRAHLAWLREHEYRTVLASEVPALVEAGDCTRWVCLTFDDGYADNLRVALPILSEFAMVATFFVITDAVTTYRDPDRPSPGFALPAELEMLDEAGLRSLQEASMEVGSHTATHVLASSFLHSRPCWAGTFEEDLTRSLEAIRQATGAAPASFAYPNGQRGAFDDRTRRALRHARVAAGFSTLWGPLARGEDRLLLPRCEVTTLTDAREFAAIMEGRRDFLYWVHRIRYGAKVWGRFYQTE